MDDPLQRLRLLCLSHPGVVERVSHGEPAWFVDGRRRFLTYADRDHDERVAFWAAAPAAAQEILMAHDPEVYFKPPYVGQRGWIGMRLDRPVDWDEVAARVAEAYAVIAQRASPRQAARSRRRPADAFLEAAAHATLESTEW